LSESQRLARAWWAASVLFVLAVSAWLAHRANTRWDYPVDAGPPIDDLAHLRLHDFLSARPDMGPLSLVIRAPFAALGQLLGNGGKAHQYLDDYRFGVFPCMVAAGLFGAILARFGRRRGRGMLACAVIVVVSVVNPVSLRAIHFGHPEEVLGAALLAGAMLAAVARRPWIACALLALTVLNKQWGLVGLPAVAVVLFVTVGWERLRRPVLGLVAIVLLLVVPLVVVDAGSLFDLTKRMADLRGTWVFPAELWYSFGGPASNGLREMPDWLGLIARPLVVTMGVVVPLMFARRVREDPLQRAFALLALVMLLRCALDPANNGYYHVPFLIAVVAADTISGRFWATAIACVLLQAPTTWQPAPQDLALFYALWAPAFAVYLGGRAYGLDWIAWLRSRGAEGRPVSVQAPSSGAT
jgi:hypothetical protein